MQNFKKIIHNEFYFFCLEIYAFLLCLEKQRKKNPPSPNQKVQCRPCYGYKKTLFALNWIWTIFVVEFRRLLSPIWFTLYNTYMLLKRANGYIIYWYEKNMLFAPLFSFLMVKIRDFYKQKSLKLYLFIHKLTHRFFFTRLPPRTPTPPVL